MKTKTNTQLVRAGKILPLAIFTVIGSFLTINSALGLTFDLPHDGNMVGHMFTVTVKQGQSLSTIGRQYDFGAYEMTEANPNLDFLNPHIGSSVTIPNKFILPDAPRKGIVINLAEMRLYFYHANEHKVSTYPIGIGQDGWHTPLGKTQVVKKKEHPWWIVPKSIIDQQRRLREPIITKMPPGPNNPLGDYALNLGFNNIVIHGTPFPTSIGLRSSHGCIRMFPEDIRALFQQVKVGTEVHIIHQSLKVGRSEGKLFLEAHMPLSESFYTDPVSLQEKVHNVVNKVGDYPYRVNWDIAHNLHKRNNGIPEPIGQVLYPSYFSDIYYEEQR